MKSIADKRLHYFRNEKNSGQEASRMNGLRHARGKYITFLDDDDYYTDYEFFAKAIEIFREHEDDEVPLVMVYANAKWLYTDTGREKMNKIGMPGRVRGLDFVLGRGYGKPPSTFPAVFRADVLRQAGLDDKIIFDSETYWESALFGDAWLMNDIIGIYRFHKQNSTNGYSNHPAQNKRLDAKVKAMAERGVLIAEGICAAAGKKCAEKWCISDAGTLLRCYRGQQNYISEIKTYGKAMLIMSGFTRKVIFIAPFLEAKRLLAKITPLRKLYRFIKYRLRGRPYPEN